MTIARCIRRCINAVGAVVGAIVPFDLDQLLLDTAQGDPYYSDSEDPSGVFTHLLADRSTQAGDLREKRLGHCLEFNGVDQAADLGVAYTNETKIAFAGWFKIPEGQTAGDVFFGNDTNTTGTRGWAMRSYGGQVLELFISPDGGVTDYYRFRYTDIADGTWHHIAFIFDAGTVSFYLDGSLTAAAVTAPVGSPAGTINASGQNTFVGAKSGPATYGELTCYDIRQAEGDAADDLIAELATIISTPVTTTTSLLSHHWMQEESGSTIYDSSGNGNHGTISGYAASQRVTDAGVKYSVANEVGVSPRMLFDGVDDLVEAQITNPFNIQTDKWKVNFKLWTGGDISSLQALFGVGDSGSAGSLSVVIIFNELRMYERQAAGFTGSICRLSIESNTLYDVTFEFGGTTENSLLTANGITDSRLVYPNDSHNVRQIHIGANAFSSGENELKPGNCIWDIRFDQGNTGEWDSHWQGYGNTNADWADLIGNQNGVVEGSPAKAVYIPPLDSSTTQDALGGELTYKGRCPMYGLAKHVAWQGNGTDVKVELDTPHTVSSEIVIECDFNPAVDNFGGLLHSGGTVLGIVSSSIPERLQFLVFDGGLLLENALQAGQGWHKLIAKKTATHLEMQVTRPDGVVKSNSIAYTSDLAGLASFELLVRQAAYGDVAIGGLAITVDGERFEYVPIEGTRNVAKITSDGSDTKIIEDAVSGGTLATLYTQGDGSWRLPHIENGARWDGTSLIPCDPLGNSPDGNDRNILPGKLDREQGVRVDRTGGKLSPLDYELGLDELTNEHGEQWVENITGDW